MPARVQETLSFKISKFGMKMVHQMKSYKYDLIVLFLIALCIRLWFCYTHFWIAGDSPDYIDLAKNLHFFNVFGFSGPNLLIPTSNPDGGLIVTAFRPLLYPLIASFVWTGEDFPYNSVLFIQSLLGAGTVVITYLIAKQYFTRPIAIASALLLVFSPLVIIVTGAILTETLFTFLTILGCYFLMKKQNILSGLTFGLVFLTRPIVLPFFFFLIVIALFSPDRKKLVGTYALITIIAVLVASPWIVRNSLIFNKLVLTQSSGYGTNLLVGSMNTPDKKDASDKDYWFLIFTEPWKFKDPPLEDKPFRDLDEADQDRERMRIAFGIIKRDPVAWLKVRTKVYPRLFLIDDGNYVLSEQNNISIGQAISQGNIFVIVVKSLLFSVSLLLFILAALGIYYLKGAYFETLTIWPLPIFFALIHLPMGIEGRYFVPALPFYYILAAFGGFYLIKRRGYSREE